MLTEKELDAQFERLGTPEKGRKLILLIRISDPVREGDGGPISSTTRYCSHKMRFTVGCEAGQTEFPAAVAWDNDTDSLEFYPQPTKLQINGVNKLGRKYAYQITPDFLRVTPESFQFVECKLEKDLLELARKNPDRYHLDENGRWRCPPAEQAALELGCEYVIRSSAENNWVLVENLELLRDYIISEAKIDASDIEVLKKRVKETPWCTIDDLINVEPKVNADVLHVAMLKGDVYFDLSKHRITDQEMSCVFRDKEAAIAYEAFAKSKTALTFREAQLSLLPGSCFEWDGNVWEILNSGSKSISARQKNNLSAEDAQFIDLPHEQVSSLAASGKIVPIATANEERHLSRVMQQFSPEQIQIGLWRHEILFETISPNNPYKGVKKRTKQYWLASYRESELECGYGFPGLISNRNHTQGNHNRKIDEAVIEITRESINKHYPDPRQKTTSRIYGEIVSECEKLGLIPPNRNFLLKELKKAVTIKEKIKRVGRKAAYDEEAIEHWWLERTTPVHGTHPFHIAHIDHTPIKLKLRAKLNGRLVRTLTLSLMIDANTRKILAVYLSFDPPSYRSCMMVIRDCVRRHGRLPQIVVSDHGPEFESIYYDTVLARFWVNKRTRPKSKPRHGSVIERIFSTTEEDFIHNLMGNAQAEDNWRKVSPEVSPARFAVWTHERFALRLDGYIEDVYHKNFNVTLGGSPEEMYRQGVIKFGERAHRRIAYVDDFIIQTCPSTRKGTSRVTNRGVKINYIYYTSPVLLDLSLRKTNVPVRYDPFDMGRAFVYVGQQWHECQSEYYWIFKNYTERAIRVATEYLHLKHRSAIKHYEINAARLADFLQSTEAEEVLGMQRLHDAESAEKRNEYSRSANTPPTDPCNPDFQKFDDDLLESDEETYVPNMLKEF